MKTFLCIKHANPEDEYDREEQHILIGNNAEEAIASHYFDESIYDITCDLTAENLQRRGGWPTINDCYIPTITLYEIVGEVTNAQDLLMAYGQRILDKAIEEQKEYIADTPNREKQAKLDALKKQAEALGLDIVQPETGQVL